MAPITIGLLKSLGVRIRRIADLEEQALYIEESKLLLLDIELDDAQITDVIDQVLPSLWVEVA